MLKVSCTKWINAPLVGIGYCFSFHLNTEIELTKSCSLLHLIGGNKKKKTQEKNFKHDPDFFFFSHSEATTCIWALLCVKKNDFEVPF